MGVVRLAVGSAVVALVAAHQLSAMDPNHRAALWMAAQAMAGGRPTSPPARMAAPVTSSAPAPPVIAASTSGGGEVLTPDRYGQFQTAVEIDGLRLSTLVDTGATFVALSYEDADRLGIRPAPSDFRYSISTANGRADVAKVELSSIRLGNIVVRDVTALVARRGQLGQTLLGMSFLSRLSNVQVDHGRMLLSQ